MNIRLLTDHRYREEVILPNGSVAPRIFVDLSWRLKRDVKQEQPHIFDIFPLAHELLADLFTGVFREEQVQLRDTVYVHCHFEHSQTTVTKLVKGEVCVNTIDSLCLAILEGMMNAQVLGLDFGPWNLCLQVMHADACPM